MRIVKSLLIVVLLGGLSLGASTSVSAKTRAQTEHNLTLFTLYPSQDAAIGDTISIPLTLRTSTAPQMVKLSVQNLSQGWKATFRGDGKAVRAAYTDPKNDVKVDLRIEPPRDAKAGTYDFTVLANGSQDQATLPIELRLQDSLPPNLAFKVDLPTLRGTPDTTFRYNATLKNEGDQDMTVTLASDAPKELQVNFNVSGQNVTSFPLAANASQNVSIEVKPFPDTPANIYQINVTAQSDKANASTTLAAEVTGESKVSLTTPDGRLSGDAYIGKDTSYSLLLTNSGSAPARNITLSASQPSGWSVEFDPKQVDELPAGQSLPITAKVKPADQAVAGDYVVSFSAHPQDGATQTADFRITVLTSTVWGFVGVVLIALALSIVGLAVVRFGRR